MPVRAGRARAQPTRTLAGLCHLLEAEFPDAASATGTWDDLDVDCLG